MTELQFMEKKNKNKNKTEAKSGDNCTHQKKGMVLNGMYGMEDHNGKKKLKSQQPY